MRAAIVVPGLSRLGGAERQAMLLAKGLHRRGWTITIVVLSGIGDEASAELYCTGIGFLDLRMRKGVADPRGWIRFARWLASWKPHVVHAHLPHATWMARWSRLALFGYALPRYALSRYVLPGYALIDTLHSSSTGSVGRHLGYHLSNWLAGTVTAVSQAVADTHCSAALVNPHKLRVIPNGVDTTALAPDRNVRKLVRARLGIGNNFLWIAAGRLAPVKNYPLLLRAMSLLPESANLLIAGEGPLRNELESLASELRIKNRVRFLGFVSGVTPYLQAADAAVLSSQWEGLPMNLLEAGACGLPCVATDVPGSREAVQDGETGFLATPENPLALAESMNRLMNVAPEIRQTMGSLARQRVVRLFDLDAVLNQWENLYFEKIGALREPSNTGLKSAPARASDC